MGVFNPSKSSSHFRLPYSSCRVALGNIQVGADLGLYHLGSPRAYTPSGQLQTMSEHHHPVPTQLILHRGWMLVFSNQSQFLQMTSLAKSLPLSCQQQSKLNYNRRVYSVHKKGTPQVPSLGDRGAFATGPYRTPTTFGHATKTQSYQISLIHKNKHREAAKTRIQRIMAQMK